MADDKRTKKPDDLAQATDDELREIMKIFKPAQGEASTSAAAAPEASNVVDPSADREAQRRHLSALLDADEAALQPPAAPAGSSEADMEAELRAMLDADEAAASGPVPIAGGRATESVSTDAPLSANLEAQLTASTDDDLKLASDAELWTIIEKEPAPTSKKVETTAPEDRAAFLEAIASGTKKDELTKQFPQSIAERKSTGGFQLFKPLVDDYATVLLARVTYDPKTKKIGNIGGVKKKLYFLYAWLDGGPQDAKVGRLISDATKKAQQETKSSPDAPPQIVPKEPVVQPPLASSASTIDAPAQPAGTADVADELDALFKETDKADAARAAAAASEPTAATPPEPTDIQEAIDRAKKETADAEAARPIQAGWMKRATDYANTTLAQLAQKFGLSSEVVADAAVTEEAARAQAAVEAETSTTETTAAPDAATEARAKTVADILAARIKDVENRTAKRRFGLETARKVYNWLGDMNLEKVFGKQTGVKGYLTRFVSLRTALSVGIMGVGALSEAGALAWIASQTARKTISMVGAYNLARNLSESREYLQKLQNLDAPSIETLRVDEIVERLATLELRTLAGKIQADEPALHRELLRVLERRVREGSIEAAEQQVSATVEGILQEVDQQRTSYTRGRIRDAALSAAYAFVLAPEIGKGLRWLMGSHADAPTASQPSAAPSPRVSAAPSPQPSPAPSAHEAIATRPPSPTPAPGSAPGDRITDPSPEASPSPVASPEAPRPPVVGAATAPATPEAKLPSATGAGSLASTPPTPPTLDTLLDAPKAVEVLKKAIGAKIEDGKLLVEFGKGKIAADSDSALRYIALAEMKLTDPQMLNALETAKLLNIRDNLKELLNGHNVGGVTVAELQGALEKTPNGWEILDGKKLEEAVHKLLKHANAIEDRLKDGGALAWADRLPSGEMAKMRAIIEQHDVAKTTHEEFVQQEAKTPPFTKEDVQSIVHAKEQVLTHQLHEQGMTVKDVHVLPDGSASFTAVDPATNFQEPLTIPRYDLESSQVSQTLAENNWEDTGDATDVTPPAATTGELHFPPTGSAPVNAADYLNQIKNSTPSEQISYLNKLVEPLRNNQTRIIKMPGDKSVFLFKHDGKLWLSSPNLRVIKEGLNINNVNTWLARILAGK